MSKLSDQIADLRSEIQELEVVRRKSAAFDGIARHQLCIRDHSDYAVHPMLSYECSSGQIGGSFGSTPLEAAENMIRMCEGQLQRDASTAHVLKADIAGVIA